MLFKLICRDLILNKKNILLFLGLMTAGFLYFYIRSTDTGFALLILYIWIALVPVSIIGREERFKATATLCSLPVSRTALVRGRYLESWLLIACGIIYVIGLTLLLEAAGITAVNLWTLPTLHDALLAFTLLTGILIPFVLRFGFTGLIVLLLIPQVLLAILMLVTRLYRSDIGAAFAAIGKAFAVLQNLQKSGWYWPAALAVLAAGNYLSYRLALLIFRNKALQELPMEYALEINHLAKNYKDFRLEDVSFSLPKGYIMGLIGLNGAGKTTLLKLILGLVQRAGGEITVLGTDNRVRETEWKNRVGFVFDEPRFYDYLTVKQTMRTIAPFYRHWDHRLFLELAARFEIPLHRRVSRLSRGMRMKFALCLALAHHPELLIMDEPTAGLDPVFRREFLKMLCSLIQDERKAVLLSTHITADLEQIADYITCLRDGKLMFSCIKEEILDHWCIIRGGKELLTARAKSLSKGFRETRYGFEALVDDKQAAREFFKGDIVVDKVRLDDILYYMQ